MDDQTRKKLEVKYNAAVDASFGKWGGRPPGHYDREYITDRIRIGNTLVCIDPKLKLRPFCYHEDGTNLFRRLDRDKCPACLAEEGQQ